MQEPSTDTVMAPVPAPVLPHTSPLVQPEVFQLPQLPQMFPLTTPVQQNFNPFLSVPSGPQGLVFPPLQLSPLNLPPTPCAFGPASPAHSTDTVDTTFMAAFQNTFGFESNILAPPVLPNANGIQSTTEVPSLTSMLDQAPPN